MCGIAGWLDWNRETNSSGAREVMERMTESLSRRGPDEAGTWLSPRASLGHRRLVVLDPKGGLQPMERELPEGRVVITYNGELYNTAELRAELIARGHHFQTVNSDTEVLLLSYLEWEQECVHHLNGIFAFGVWDERKETLLLARDRMGVKPLFYYPLPGELIFASEPKALLQHPRVKPEIDAEGWAELLALGPSRTPGQGVFRGMRELPPGYILKVDRQGSRENRYWDVSGTTRSESAQETAEKLRWLPEDIVKRQLISDVPVCTLLSGGLDSTALTAFASEEFQREGAGPLHTYSVDYVDNRKYFQSGAFQPDSDDRWVDYASRHLGTLHHRVLISPHQLVKTLKDAVLAKDMPGMTDIDTSLFLSCREIK